MGSMLSVTNKKENCRAFSKHRKDKQGRNHNNKISLFIGLDTITKTAGAKETSQQNPKGEVRQNFPVARKIYPRDVTRTELLFRQINIFPCC